MPVKFQGELAEGTFLSRPNRFLLWVEVDGEPVKAHCPTSGRIGELTVEGTRFLIRRRPDARPDQATAHSAIAGWHNGGWVVIDTHMVNRLVAHGLDAGAFQEVFGTIEHVRAEPPAHQGRFDFELTTPNGPVLVEAKSVTLLDEQDGRTGRFPDAPTERGTRHVRELTERACKGEGAAVLFVAMRADVEQVAPNRATDPAFGQALEEAAKAGVQVVAWNTHLEGPWLHLGGQVPVRLEEA